MTWFATVVSAYVTPRTGPSRSFPYAPESNKIVKGIRIICDIEQKDDTGGSWFHCPGNGLWYPGSVGGKTYMTREGGNSNVTSNSGATNGANNGNVGTTGNEILYSSGISNTILNMTKEADKLLEKSIDGSVRMFGMPHQLTPENDHRISNKSRLGRMYAENFTMNAPIIYLRPGTANFLPDSSADDQKGLLAAIMQLDGDSSWAHTDLKKKLEQIQGDQKYVKYFEFQAKFADYMSKVNLLCRLGATFLKIDKVKVPWHGSGAKMCFGNYDWRNSLIV